VCYKQLCKKEGRFRCKFQDAAFPRTETILRTVNKLRQKGSAVEKTNELKYRVFTAEKLSDLGAGTVRSSGKSFRLLAQFQNRQHVKGKT
jgi:hypothetical protein